jgi:hypothetical protein
LADVVYIRIGLVANPATGHETNRATATDPRNPYCTQSGDFKLMTFYWTRPTGVTHMKDSLLKVLNLRKAILVNMVIYEPLPLLLLRQTLKL